MNAFCLHKLADGYATVLFLSSDCALFVKPKELVLIGVSAGCRLGGLSFRPIQTLSEKRGRLRRAITSQCFVQWWW